MSKHTPGPWEYDAEFSKYSEQGTDFTIYAGDVEIIGGCGCCGSPTIRNEANARLIAAAPELLEALKSLVCIDYRSWDDSAQQKWEAACDAVAKAEGESKL